MERKQIVEAICYVDKVIPQVDRDKYGAWEKLKFDIMFVGDDWKGTPLFSELENKFKGVGVSIEYFPYTQGTSSTVLREKLDKIK